MLKGAGFYWLLVIAFLLLGLAGSGIVLATKQSSHKPVEIVLSPPHHEECKYEVYIGGAVANPGVYPLKEDDTIEAIIQAANPMPDADLSHIEIYVSKAGDGEAAQKINLNRAQAWLLAALPGIGKGKAQAIVDYRNAHGPFRRVEDLLKVDGISNLTLDRIRNLITVED